MALRRPKSMLIRLEGKLAAHVTAKDMALRIIAELGVAGARGHVAEYAGAAEMTSQTVRETPGPCRSV